MWIKVNETIHFERRAAIATLERADFINNGFPLDDLRKFSRIDEFNEDFLRKFLMAKYEGVDKWQLHTVIYRYEYGWLDVVVTSPDFETVEDGMMLERLLSIREKEAEVNE
jgi:hypothetical protein